MSKVWGLFCVVFGCSMLLFGVQSIFSDNDLNGRVIGVMFFLAFGAIKIGFSKFKAPEEDIDPDKVIAVLQAAVDEQEAKKKADQDKDAVTTKAAPKQNQNNQNQGKGKKKKKKKRK